MLKRIFFILALSCVSFAQLPQSSTTTDQPASVQMVNGVGPGYRPTKGTGLTLNLSKGGTQCVDKWIDYSGATLSLTDNATSWVYIDPAQDCIPVASATEPGQGVCRNSKVVTASGAISSITDQRVAGCAISKVNVTAGSGGTGGSGGGANATGNYLISGGGLNWTGGLNFTIPAATYIIAGTQYSSPQTDITLTAADSTDPRQDLVVYTSAGTVLLLTGTAAPTPAAPNVAPNTQLAVGPPIQVPAGATEPTGVSSTDIYQENAEYTCSASANFNCASTSNPSTGTKDIEATSAGNTDSVTLTKPSGTLDLSTFSTLTFKIRSKAAWANAKSLSIFWSNGTTVPTGSASVALRTGLLGFSSSVTGSYQQIVIPITSFALGSTAVNRLNIKVAGGGGAIGFYIDDVTLQTGTGGTSTNGVACSQLPTFTGDVANGGGASCTLTIASAAVTNSKLLNPSVTVNGTTCTLGSSCAPAGAGAVGTSGSPSAPKIAVFSGAASITNIGTPATCSSGNYARGIDANGDATGCTVASAGTVTGSSLTSGQLITGAGSSAIQTGNLSGDVTTSGSTATTLTNLPDGVTQAGHLLATNIAAPSSPASGKVKLFTDSTDLRFHDKNASGTIGTTVTADTGSTNNFLTAISAAGAISKARPTCANLSDSSGGCTMSTTAGGDLSGTLPSPTVATKLRWKTCMINVGADNAAAVIADGDLGPQKRRCFVPFASTITEITVSADAGTPNVLLQRRRGNSTVADLLSAALATASSGNVACAMSSTSQTCYDGTTSSGSITLSNTTLNAGDYIELKSGTAGGVAKSMQVAVTFTIN